MTNSQNLLKKFFGYDNFRPGQEEIINNILNQNDCLGIMPTGAGKSICYQIPAMLLPGVTIVISPLISLMKDQVDNLNQIGIPATFINSSLSHSEYSQTINNIMHNVYKIIYVAPERLTSEAFLNLLNNLQISMFTIDEAHCVSQWGHDFRPSYREIANVIVNLKTRPVVSAFTATATNIVKKDIINLLHLQNPFTLTTGFDRANLKFSVQIPENKNKYILNFLQNQNDIPGIIYCATRKEVDGLYYYLKDLGYNVLKYHGGLKDSEKEYYQDEFLNENSNVMIATNAFGMGIDKSNVRYIIHFTIPKNIESYYQEIGRAGRDGLTSECHLLFNRGDIRTLEYLIHTTVQLNRKEIEIKKLQKMIDFCESKECLRSFILKYFGEGNVREYCTNCSNCLNNDELRDYTIEAQKVLSCVYRTKERYGISVLIDILRGMTGPKIINDKLNELTTYGIMKDYSSKFIRDFIKMLIEYGYVSLKDGTYSMLKLNEKSYKILKSQLKVMLKLTSESEEKVINSELFNRLRGWRREMAIKEGVKPYIIFSDATLIELCNKNPKNEDELLDIRGMGEKKFKKYGCDLLNLLNK